MAKIKYGSRVLPRVKVQTLKSMKYSQSEVAKKLGLHISFVKRWWNRQNVADDTRMGHPPKLTRSFLLKLFKKTEMKRRRSNRIIAKEMGCSTATVYHGHQLLHQHAYHLRKVPILNKKHIRERLQFAQANVNTDWTKIIFTDEKKVGAFAKPNSKNDVIYAVNAVDVPPAEIYPHELSLNVSGAVCYAGAIPVKIFKENLTGGLYANILQSHLIPECRKLMKTKFQVLNDGARTHLTKAVLGIHAAFGVQRFKIPANSPDINIQENVWSMLVQNMPARRPKTLSALREVIRDAWEKIPLTHIKNCIESMPSRIQRIIEMKGGFTGH